MRTLSVLAFAGGCNWPLWAGQQSGLFARHDLGVELAFARNSVEMARDMMAGRYQVAMTAFDNVVAYREGQGAAVPDQAVDFIAYLGADTGALSVMAAPGIDSFADLRGKEIAVDAMNTGFAFVLREILARNGIREEEVKLVSVGGGAQRLQALQERRQAATLLNTPLDLIAEHGGARRLARAEDVIGAYQGVVGMARRSWAAGHGELLIAFMRGYRDAMAWLYDRGNRIPAVELLVHKMAGMTPELAQHTYEVLLADKGALIGDLDIDLDGARTVLALRSRYAPAQMPLGDPGPYIDMSFRGLALD